MHPESEPVEVIDGFVDVPSVRVEKETRAGKKTWTSAHRSVYSIEEGDRHYPVALFICPRMFEETIGLFYQGFEFEDHPDDPDRLDREAAIAYAHELAKEHFKKKGVPASKEKLEKMKEKQVKQVLKDRLKITDANLTRLMHRAKDEKRVWIVAPWYADDDIRYKVWSFPYDVVLERHARQPRTLLDECTDLLIYKVNREVVRAEKMDELVVRPFVEHLGIDPNALKASKDGLEGLRGTLLIF